MRQQHTVPAAHALAPGSFNAYYLRGNARAGLKQWEEAAADYTQVLGLQPQNAAACYDRGKARAQLGQRDLASADFKRAVELNPIFAGAKYQVVAGTVRAP